MFWISVRAHGVVTQRRDRWCLPDTVTCWHCISSAGFNVAENSCFYIITVFMTEHFLSLNLALIVMWVLFSRMYFGNINAAVTTLSIVNVDFRNLYMTIFAYYLYSLSLCMFGIVKLTLAITWCCFWQGNNTGVWEFEEIALERVCMFTALSILIDSSLLCTLCSEKKHPLTFSFITPQIICGFKQKLQWIYPRIDRFWQCKN